MIGTFGRRERALPAACQLPQAGQPPVGAALDHDLDERKTFGIWKHMSKNDLFQMELHYSTERHITSV